MESPFEKGFGFQWRVSVGPRGNWFERASERDGSTLSIRDLSKTARIGQPGAKGATKSLAARFDEKRA